MMFVVCLLVWLSVSLFVLLLCALVCPFVCLFVVCLLVLVCMFLHLFVCLSDNYPTTAESFTRLNCSNIGSLEVLKLLISHRKLTVNYQDSKGAGKVWKPTR